MATVTIYGASDDLVELDGDIREEFSALREDEHDDGGIVAFSDGTVLSVRYTSEGIWRVNRLSEGSAAFAKSEALGDAGWRDDGPPAYSDVATLDGDLRWAVFGSSFVIARIGAE